MPVHESPPPVPLPRSTAVPPTRMRARAPNRLHLLPPPVEQRADFLLRFAERLASELVDDFQPAQVPFDEIRPQTLVRRRVVDPDGRHVRVQKLPQHLDRVRTCPQ